MCDSFRCGAVERERTLAMIKPDGLSGNYTDKIKEAILESGFDIIEEGVVLLDAERASLFYAEHAERSFFDSLVKYMTRYVVQKTRIFCSSLVKCKDRVNHMTCFVKMKCVKMLRLRFDGSYLRKKMMDLCFLIKWCVGKGHPECCLCNFSIKACSIQYPTLS